jgi:hypothetical protein
MTVFSGLSLVSAARSVRHFPIESCREFALKMVADCFAQNNIVTIHSSFGVPHQILAQPQEDGPPLPVLKLDLEDLDAERVFGLLGRAQGKVEVVGWCVDIFVLLLPATFRRRRPRPSLTKPRTVAGMRHPQISTRIPLLFTTATRKKLLHTLPSTLLLTLKPSNSNHTWPLRHDGPSPEYEKETNKGEIFRSALLACTNQKRPSFCPSNRSSRLKRASVADVCR